MLSVQRPSEEPTHLVIATLWEFPLAAAPSDAPLPPPRLVATWRDVYARPPPLPPAIDDPDEEPRTAFMGPVLCRATATLACVTAGNRLALRDHATDEVRHLRSLEDVPADRLYTVISDKHPAGARHLLLESVHELEHNFTLIDADADVELSRFRLPPTQQPLLYSDRGVACQPASARYLLTGEAVYLDDLATREDDEFVLSVLTAPDGARCVGSLAADCAAAAQARDMPAWDGGSPTVILYRIIECLTGATIARTALPAPRSEQPLLFNGNVVACEILPDSGTIRTLFYAPDAAGQARLLMWCCDGRTLPLPAAATLPPRDTVYGVAPFEYGIVDAATWRFAVVSEHAEGVFGLSAPGDVTVLDFMTHG